MTEQEKFNAEVQMRLMKQDAKFELFMNELKEQREDLRRLQDRQDLLQQKTDEKFVKLQEQLHSYFTQTMLGVGGMIVALGGLLIAVLR